VTPYRSRSAFASSVRPAARLAPDPRQRSEWTHLSCRTECVHADQQTPGDRCHWL